MGFIIGLIIILAISVVIISFLSVADVTELGYLITLLFVALYLVFFLECPTPKGDIQQSHKVDIVSVAEYDLVPLSKIYPTAEDDQYITVNTNGEFGYYTYKDGILQYYTCEEFQYTNENKNIQKVFLITPANRVRRFFTLQKEKEVMEVIISNNSKVYITPN